MTAPARIPDATLTPRIAEVARLYQARWTVQAIAERMRIAPRAVRDYATRARKAGVALPRAPYLGNGNGRVDPLRAARMNREGISRAEIAAAFGVKGNAVSRRLVALAAAGVDVGKLRRGARR